MRRAPLRALLALLALLATASLAGVALAAPPAYRPPRPEVRTLANGLQVQVLPAPGSGLVHVQLRIPAGIAAEPAGQEGVSALVAQLLTAGTTLRNAERINRDLTQLGATTAAASGPEFATVSATFLARDAETGIGLIADLVTHPLFPDEEARRAQRIALALAIQGRDAAAAADEQALSAALPGHPAARPPFGTAAALRQLRPADLRAFHRERYRPAGAALAIAGDLTPERAFALAEEWLGSWSGSAAPTRVMADSSAARIRVVERENATVAEVRVAYAVPGRVAADRTAREFAAELFARELAGRRRGWTSRLQLYQDRGVWTLSASVPVDSVAAAVRDLRRAFTDFTGRPRAAAQIESGARLVRTLLPRGFETLSQRAGRWLQADFAGDPADAFETLPGRIAKLSAAEVRAAAARGVDLERPAIVAVGPAARIAPRLGDRGEVLVVDSRRTETGPAFDAASPEAVRRGRLLVAEAMAAHGGEERLRSISDTVVESEMTLSIRGETASGDLRQVRKDPDRMKLITTFARTRRTYQVLNGPSAWSLLPGDTLLREGDSTEVAGLRTTYRSDPVRLLRAASDTSTRVAHRGRQAFGDREVEVVDVRFGDGIARRLFFDPTLRRLAGIEALDLTRALVTPARSVFADYRQVQGVWWPFEERRLVGDEPYITLRTRSVAFNTGVSDDEFQAPSAARSRTQR